MHRLGSDPPKCTTSRFPSLLWFLDHQALARELSPACWLAFCEFRHVSVGNLLRSYAQDKSEVGLRLRRMMALGTLVPDTLVLDVLATRISEPDCARGLILDGFPRTLRQADLLERGLLESPFYSANLRESLVAIHLRVQHSTIRGETLWAPDLSSLWRDLPP